MCRSGVRLAPGSLSAGRGIAAVTSGLWIYRGDCCRASVAHFITLKCTVAVNHFRLLLRCSVFSVATIIMALSMPCPSSQRIVEVDVPSSVRS